MKDIFPSVAKIEKWFTQKPSNLPSESVGHEWFEACIEMLQHYPNLYARFKAMNFNDRYRFIEKLAWLTFDAQLDLPDSIYHKIETRQIELHHPVIADGDEWDENDVLIKKGA